MTFNIEMEDKRDPRQIAEPSHPPYELLPEVILETQLHPSNMSERYVYNDILISIGLDSPIASRDKRDKDRNRNYAFNQGQIAQGVNTPIRNYANSLIALGKHVLTPNQGRIWEF